MGNTNTAKFSKQGKQNSDEAQTQQKTISRGTLSIYAKLTKQGKKIYSLIFQTSDDASAKVIRWKRQQFQISDIPDLSHFSESFQLELGEFSELEIIEAIQWSSTGAFSNRKSYKSNEWCETVCWKLGKKVSIE